MVSKHQTLLQSCRSEGRSKSVLRQLRIHTLYGIGKDMSRLMTKPTFDKTVYEPLHDKTNNVAVRPAKIPVSAWASAQSDQQSLHCPNEVSLGP